MSDSKKRSSVKMMTGNDYLQKKKDNRFMERNLLNVQSLSFRSGSFIDQSESFILGFVMNRIEIAD